MPGKQTLHRYAEIERGFCKGVRSEKDFFQRRREKPSASVYLVVPNFGCLCRTFKCSNKRCKSFLISITNFLTIVKKNMGIFEIRAIKKQYGC